MCLLPAAGNDTTAQPGTLSGTIGFSDIEGIKSNIPTVPTLSKKQITIDTQEVKHDSRILFVLPEKEIVSNAEDTVIQPDTNIHPSSTDILALRTTNFLLNSAITGGLLYIKSRQVEDKKYRIQPHDFSYSGKPFQYGVNHLRSFLGNFLVPGRHLNGNWPSFVSFSPKTGIPALQPLFMNCDYNLFVTASTAHSLALLDDQLLPNEKRFLEKMNRNVFNAIEKYKRENRYSFWELKKSSQYPFSFVAPENIPVRLLTIRKRFFDLTGLWELKGFHGSEIIMEWINEIYTPKINKTGAIAMFNIPTDTDDTSLATALKLLAQKDSLIPEVDLLPLWEISRHRDLNRDKRDPRNSIIDQETGACLTWHKNEDLPVFSFPEEGIIPLKTNNVDLVVNANALYALSLANLQSEPVYRDIVKLLAGTAYTGTWKKMNIYYPEKLWFPFALSRAVRMGKITDPELDSALFVLLEELLQMHQGLQKESPGFAGAFPPFDGISFETSTALGLNALLNIGADRAKKASKQDCYQNAIEKSVNFLLSRAKTQKKSRTGTHLVYWRSGPLFSSSVHELAYWYSTPLNTALVIEAFCKYLMGFDILPDKASPQRLQLSFAGGKYIVKP